MALKACKMIRMSRCARAFPGQSHSTVVHFLLLAHVKTSSDLNQQNYMKDLYNSCMEAIELSAAPPNASNCLSAQIALAPVIVANPGNSWAITSEYVHNIVADYCMNRTTTAWLGRLAGADVYGQDNVVTMIFSLRIDYGVLGPNGVADT